MKGYTAMTKLVWHIDRAKFEFENVSDIEEWKSNPDVFFEFSPSSADEPGDDLFVDVYDIEIYQKIEGNNSKVNFKVEDDRVIVSAWVTVDVETTEDFNEESFSEWADELGGWYSASISLGDFDATITEDDGGEWRIG